MGYLSIIKAVECLNRGEIVAYPTEAVFGLGCLPDDPIVLQTLLRLKERDVRKGLILLSHSIECLLPYIDLSEVPKDRWQIIQQTWPGPYTWVFPATKRVSSFVRGQFDSVAVRVTAHPIASALSRELGSALISTSANLSNSEPCKEPQQLLQQFEGKIAGVVEGSLGASLKPTSIQDALTGVIYR